MSGKFLLYGSYGYTGELIARLAVYMGLEPILAGRDGGKLQAQADELGLARRAFTLDDTIAMDAALSDVDAVLNCAGPFSETAYWVVAACLRNNVHYLDITGEVSVFQSLAAMDEQARKEGVMLLPGVGIDIVPSNCLASYLKDRLPTANRLTLAIRSRGGSSRGTLKTSLEQLETGAVIREDGELKFLPVGSKFIDVDFGSGLEPAILIPWGDVVAAYHSTGIPNISAYLAVPSGLQQFAEISQQVEGLARSVRLRSFLQNLSDLMPEGPSVDQRAFSNSSIWGQVEDPAGNLASARLKTPNAYTLTAQTSVLAMQAVLAGNPPPGFQTPASAFGADFIMQIEQVERIDIL